MKAAIIGADAERLSNSVGISYTGRVMSQEEASNGARWSSNIYL